MSSNSRNVKLPFLTTRCLCRGVDVPVDLLIWAVTVEMWNHHSWPLDASTRGVDVPVDLLIWAVTVENVKLPFLTTRFLYQGGIDLPIWALTVEMWNCHSCLLDASTRGVDLPVDLLIWAVKVAMWNHHSCPLDASTGGGRCASWSANMSCNSRNVKLPFLPTRCLYWGLDLPVDLLIWTITVEI